MAEPSRAAPSRFTLGTVAIGLVVLTVLGAFAAFGLARLRRPDPGRLLYAAGGALYERDLESGKVKRIARLRKDTFIALPSPSGEWVSYANFTGNMWMLNLRDGRRFQLTESNSYPQAWSPDDRLLARDPESLVLVDPEGGNRRFPVRSILPIWLDRDRFVVGGPAGADEIKFVHTFGLRVVSKGIGALPVGASPDGRRVIATRGETVVVADVSKDEMRRERVVLKGQAWTAASSPQGFLAFAARDRKQRSGLYVLDGTARAARLLLKRNVDALDWSKAGAAIIFQRKGVLYVLRPPYKEPKRITRSSQSVYLRSFTVVD